MSGAAGTGPAMPAPDRLPPPEVAPVTTGGVRYEVIHWGRDAGFEQNGGHIRAVDPATGASLWTLEVYHIDYDPDGIEYDGQDIFIRKMSKAWFANRLDIEDERGRRYRVDLKTRAVTAV